MVTIIENKAKIEGKVNDIQENARPGYCQVQLELCKSEPIEHYPNLAKADEGSVITINATPQQLTEADIKVGNHICTNVRKVFGQQYFMD